MLSSIHPLGERARDQNWIVTAVSYVAGSVSGGAATGLAAGAIGSVALQLWEPSPTAVAVALATAATVGFLADATQRRLPTVHRQVNEDWLDAYRGWVYGAGFGFQLGLGWATIITTSLVYSTFFAAALTGSPVGGAVIGSVFGFVRSMPIWLTRRIDSPARLMSFHQRMESLAVTSARTAALAQAGVAVVVFAWAWSA